MFFGATVATNMVARILLALGISFITYQGLDVILSGARSQLMSLFSSLPPKVLYMLGLGDVDFCINMILSAYGARLALFAVKQMRVTK